MSRYRKIEGEKVKVAGGVNVNIVLDNALDSTSENGVQNKVVAEEIEDIKEDLAKIVVSISSDGVKTSNQIYAELWTAFNTIDTENGKNNSKIRQVALDGNIKIFNLVSYSTTYAKFICETDAIQSTGVVNITEFMTIAPSNSNTKSQSEIFIPLSGSSVSPAFVSYSANQSNVPAIGYDWELITVGH